ncbi:MAG: hypothetical protein ACREA0_21465, partial [bacterium]
ELPVWINAFEVVVDDPQDEIEITLKYTVQAPEERRAVAAFCAEAVSITDGRTPSLNELNELMLLAETELDSDGYRALTDPLAELTQDLAAYWSGTGGGYSTAEVNEVIGRICNVNMLSESVIVD